MNESFDSNKHEETLPTLETILNGEIAARWSSPILPKNDPVLTPNHPTYEFSSPKVDVGKYTFKSSSSTAIPHEDSSFCDDSVQKTRNSVKCDLCPKNCVIEENNVGFCSARINRGGRLLARFYGRPTSIAVDPIEKKPLFHFLPGTKILSLGTQGCNLACKFCQNWQISRPLAADSTIQRVLEPRRVVDLALENNCPSVAFTYNEPTVWAEYVVDTAQLCKKNGIKTVVVTNGMIVGQARKEFYENIDAANVDLKGFTSVFYSKLVNGSLDAVKDTLEYIVKETNVWLEITNLLIPTKNDSPEEIEKLCRWIADALGHDIPLHFSAFFPTWRLTDVPPTPAQTLQQASKIAKQSGISYVYCGNIPDPESQKTLCPNCGSVLVERHKYIARVMPTLGVVPLNSNGGVQSEPQKDRRSNSSARYCQNCGMKISGIY